MSKLAILVVNHEGTDPQTATNMAGSLGRTIACTLGPDDECCGAFPNHAPHAPSLPLMELSWPSGLDTEDLFVLQTWSIDAIDAVSMILETIPMDPATALVVIVAQNGALAQALADMITSEYVTTSSCRVERVNPSPHAELQDNLTLLLCTQT